MSFRDNFSESYRKEKVCGLFLSEVLSGKVPLLAPFMLTPVSGISTVTVTSKRIEKVCGETLPLPSVFIPSKVTLTAVFPAE